MRNDDKIKALRKNFWHEGYSIRNMILEKLCKAENFELVFDDFNIELWSWDFDIEKEKLDHIIQYLLKMKLILKRDDTNIIYSQKMIDRFWWLIDKRNRDIERLSKLKQQNKIVIADDNTQSKVNKSKVNKSKKNNTKIITQSDDCDLPEKQENFWKQEINDLIKELKNTAERIWISYDKQNERNFWKHIVSAKEFWEFCEKIWQARIEFAKNIMIASVKINFWKWACAWPMKIYQNYSEVYNLAKKKQNEPKKVAFIPWIWQNG